MNVFVLDNDPIISAQQHCDKHVVKMIIESAQMLSTTHRMLDGKAERRPSVSGKTMQQYYVLPDERENLLYKAVHKYHPCTVWTMETNENYSWHWKLFDALCDEYSYRYGKTHKTDELLREELLHTPKNISKGPMTKFPLAMKSNPECMFDDPVKSYRAFYKTKQERFKMAWTKRETPSWFIN
jgi:hypothetical protein